MWKMEREMYADDSTLTVTGQKVAEVEHSLNENIKDASNWCTNNKMVNGEKNQNYADYY